MDATESPVGHIHPRWHLQVLMLLAVIVHACLILNTEVASRDSIGFIRYALQFETPPPDPANSGEPLSRLAIIRRAEHPPGYPLMVWAMSVPVRAINGGLTADNMVLATQLVSSLAALLLIFPMYNLVRRMFDPTAAFRAVALFQLLPVPAQITSDGLSDGLYLLLMVTALSFAVAGLQEDQNRRFLLAGLFTGLAYLVRPEGMLMIFAVGAILLIGRFTRLWNWRIAVRRMLLVGIGTAAIAGPYMLAIGKFTNKASGGVLMETMQGNDVAPTWHMDGKGAATQVSDRLLATWWTAGFSDTKGRILWAIGALTKEVSKTAHYGVFAIGILGIGIMLPRWRRDPVLGLPLMLGLLNAGLLWMLAVRVGYLSERHTLWLATLCTIFAAGAIPTISGLLARMSARIVTIPANRWATGLVALLLIAGVPNLFKRMHANREGHHVAGLWLAEHATLDDRIYDPFCWADYYAGRVFLEGWVTQPTFAPMYIIVEPDNLTPHSRLPALDKAKEMIQSGKPVFTWPAGRPVEKSRVAIYRVYPQPVPGTASK